MSAEQPATLDEADERSSGSSATARQRSGGRAPARGRPPPRSLAASATISIGSSRSSQKPGNSISTAARPLEHELGRVRRRDLASGTPPSRGEDRAPTRRPPPASRAERRGVDARPAGRSREACPTVHGRAVSRRARRCRPRTPADRARARPRSTLRRRRPTARRGSGRRRNRGIRPSAVKRPERATNARMRSTACSRFSSDEAYETRRWSVAWMPKALPASSATPGLDEEPLGERVRVDRQPRDVREGVERATRLDARDPGNRVQRRHEVVATAAELGHHRGDRVLRALERRHAGELDERRHARRRVDDQAGQRIDEIGGNGGVPEPPARHRERLREPVEQDRAIEHAREARRSTAPRRRR